MRKFHQGQQGFTLIELLVVVGILAVLSAVVALNLGRFIGTGTVEAANAEAHNVQTAVIAYMAENNLSDYDGTVGPGRAADPSGPENYLYGSLQATYTIEDGQITDATPAEDGKWKDLTWSADAGWTKQ